MIRDEMYRAQTMALAVISESESPDYLRQMALEVYGDLAFHLQWNDFHSDTSESKSGLLLWPGAYEYAANQVLDHLPDQVKVTNPVDVWLAHGLAKSIDQHGHSVDMRLELLQSLRRTLQRLLRAAAESGTQFDLPEYAVTFLGHLARTDPFPVEDDDETFIGTESNDLVHNESHDLGE